MSLLTSCFCTEAKSTKRGRRTTYSARQSPCDCASSSRRRSKEPSTPARLSPLFPEQKMTLRPNSIQARDVAHVLHPYTNASLHERIGPVVISRGEGIYVFDDEGNRYIEGLSGLFCASLGFSEERLVVAASRQMRKLPFYHSFGGKTNEPSVELAERLIA